MNSVEGSKFYIEKPLGEHWNRFFGQHIIEAVPFINNVIEEKIKVIKPEDFKRKYLKKAIWEECSGPVRQVNFEEYVQIYHEINPTRPLPKGWSQMSLE